MKQEESSREARIISPVSSARPPIRTQRGFLQLLLHRPRQLLLRRAAFQLHLWAGVLLALYVVAIGVSGSLLVFKQELLPRPHVSITGPAPRGCTPAQLVAALGAVRLAYSASEPYLVACPDESNPLISVTLRPLNPSSSSRPEERTVFLHPLTGAVLGERDLAHSWVNAVYRFHVELLLPRHGRTWNGLFACVLLALALSGVVLWWPGIAHWARAFTIDLRRGWKRINYDLHSALGIWTLAFTLIWALTGTYFAWPASWERAIARLSSLHTATYPEQQIAALDQRRSATAQPPLRLEPVLIEAMRRSPGATLSGLFYGTGPRPILTVYLARARAGDYTRTDFLYLDQRTGKLLYTWHRGANQSAGDWALWLLAPLHFGTSWGLGIKIVWAAAGAAFPALAVTGLLMYWNRWLSKRLRRA